MEDKVSHDDIVAVHELLHTNQWKVVKKLLNNYVWAIRKQFDNCSTDKDMFFHQGEIAGTKLFIKKLEDLAKRAEREEAKHDKG